MEDGVTFLAFVEAVLRDSPKHAEELDKLYAVGLSAGPRPVTQASRDERIAQIQRAQRVFGG